MYEHKLSNFTLQSSRRKVTYKKQKVILSHARDHSDVKIIFFKKIIIISFTNETQTTALNTNRGHTSLSVV